jgi:hypothetical protein
VFDVFTDLARGVDGGDRKMGHLVRTVQFDPAGLTPLMVHHTGWSNEGRPRGRGSIVGANDVWIAVQSDVDKEGSPNQITRMKLTNTEQKKEAKFQTLVATLTIPVGSGLEYPVVTSVVRSQTYDRSTFNRRLRRPRAPRLRSVARGTPDQHSTPR